MGNKVNSKNILFYLKVDGVYYNVFCGQGLDWMQSQEMIETTNVNSGSTTDYESGMSVLFVLFPVFTFYATLTVG